MIDYVPAGSLARDWIDVLSSAAPHVPGARLPHDMKGLSEIAVVDPERLALDFGILLIPVAIEDAVHPSIPLFRTTRGSSPGDQGGSGTPDDAAWAAAPLLTAASSRPITRWFLKRWAIQLGLPILLTVPTMVVAILAFGEVVTNDVGRKGGIAFIALVASLVVLAAGVAWARLRVREWKPAIIWFLDAAITTAKARQTRAGSSDTGKEELVGVAISNSVASAMLRTTPVIVLAMSALASGLVLCAVYAPLLLLLVISIPVTVLVLALVLGGSAMGQAARAEAAADDARGHLLDLTSRRLASVESDPVESSAYVGNVVSSAGHMMQRFRYSRTIAAIATLGGTVSPLLTLAVAAGLWRFVSVSESSTVAAVLTGLFLVGGFWGVLLESALREAVSLSPLTQVAAVVRGIEEPRPPGATPDRFDGLTLENVILQASDGVSRPLTLDMQTRQRMCLVTADPVIATNLAEALAGLQPPLSGRVLIDCNERPLIDVVPLSIQQVVIDRNPTLPGTTLEDVVGGSTGDHVSAALERVSLHSFIDRLPLGLATPLLGAERWMDQSVRLRLLLARGLLRNPELTIIDQGLDRLIVREQTELFGIFTSWPGWLVIVSTEPTLPVPAGFTITSI